MKNPSDQKWDLLRVATPGEEERIRMRNKIRTSIRSQPKQKTNYGIFVWKNVLLTCLFMMISAGLLIQLQKQNPSSDVPGQSQAVKEFTLKWDLENIYSKKNENGYVFLKEGNSVQVGMAEFVTDEEKNKIINTRAMNMAKELVDFPYNTSLYIEHVKMMDVSLRYHFFVEAGKDTMHFSFDYPKLEYAEIFQIISSLDFNDPQPYRHYKPLYVTHGYGRFPFPVGLRPVEVDGDSERYNWEQGIPDYVDDYIEKIKSTGEWNQIEGGVSSYIFEATDGSQIVKISVNGKEISYEHSYPNRNE